MQAGNTMREILPGLWLHPRRMGFLEKSRALLVADAHLGFTHVLRRRGALLPAFDLGLPDDLVRAAADCGATRVVFLGDVVEAPKPCVEERRHVDEVLERLGIPATMVLGNHDRHFAVDYPHLESVASLELDGFALHHGDKAPPEHPGPFVIGHFHPALRIRDGAGVSHLLAAAVTGPRGVCLPAASPFSTGLALTPANAPAGLTAWIGPLRRAIPTAG